MRAGSADPLWIALSTAVARAFTRESMSAGGVPVAVITCQPSSRVQFCQVGASAGSISAIAGAFVCAARDGQSSRLIVTQARANSFGQFLDVIGLLKGRHGEHVAI